MNIDDQRPTTDQRPNDLRTHSHKLEDFKWP